MVTGWRSAAPLMKVRWGWLPTLNASTSTARGERTIAPGLAQNDRAFARLWNNETARLSILPFPEAAQQRLLRFRTTDPPDRDPEEVARRSANRPQIPGTVSLRDYQTEAIRNWAQHNGRGTLKMATGSGKSITAIGAAAMLAERKGLKALIIVCPFRHLVTQWARELTRFGVHSILCHESRQRWAPELAAQLLRIEFRQRFLCLRDRYDSNLHSRYISSKPPALSTANTYHWRRSSQLGRTQCVQPSTREHLLANGAFCDPGAMV